MLGVGEVRGPINHSSSSFLHDATLMAKVVSERYGTTVAVARECSRWRVFFSADEELTYEVRASLMKRPLRKTYPYDVVEEFQYSDEDERDPYSDEVAQEILEDIFDYQDSIARAIDDGWFYSDD